MDVTITATIVVRDTELETHTWASMVEAILREHVFQSPGDTIEVTASTPDEIFGRIAREISLPRLLSEHEEPAWPRPDDPAFDDRY